MIQMAAAILLCTVVAVADGDTLTCSDGTRVRIWGINAPEITDARGPASRDTLLALTLGSTLACERRGMSYDRIVALCRMDGLDVAAVMVEAAQARDCPRYSDGAYAWLEDERHETLPDAGFCHR